MTNFIITKKNEKVLGQIIEEPVISVLGVKFLQKKIKDTAMDPTEKEEMTAFIKTVKKLGKTDIVWWNYTPLMTHTDAGGRLESYKRYSFYSVETLGRFLIRSKSISEKHAHLDSLDNWAFDTARDIKKQLKQVRKIMKKYSWDVTIHENTLQKLLKIQSEFEKGNFLIEKNTLEQTHMQAQSYVLYVRQKDKEGFLLPNNELGPLQGAQTFETLEGAKRREKNHQHSKIVAIEAKISAIVSESSDWDGGQILEAMTKVNRDNLQKYLDSASREQLLEKLKALDGADDLIKEQPVRKIKM